MLSKFKLRNILGPSHGDAAEVLEVSSGETAVPLGDVGRDRKRGTIELVDQEAVTALELFG